MPTCNECKNYYGREEAPEKGDCVQRAVDPRQGYHKAKPVEAEKEAGGCDSFQKK